MNKEWNSNQYLRRNGFLSGRPTDRLLDQQTQPLKDVRGRTWKERTNHFLIIFNVIAQTFFLFFSPSSVCVFPLISRWYSMVEKVKGYMFRPTEGTEAKARPIDPNQAANVHFIRPIVYETPCPPRLETWGKNRPWIPCMVSNCKEIVKRTSDLALLWHT